MPAKLSDNVRARVTAGFAKLVEEVIQKDLAPRTRGELLRILEDDSCRESMKEGYRELIDSLGERGVSRRLGKRMIELIKEESE